jgi:DNA-binding NarL/FixJ family response regulator
MEVELKSYTKELEDANTALRIFMDRRECTGMMLEEKLQFNVDELVAPYLKKLRETELNSRQENYLNVLENNLKNIVSPYMFKMSTTYKNLTPQEIQIANLIRLGKNTKDIAELLNTSAHTVGTHRNNIRKKMKLRNSKSNLRSHLLSLI